MPTGFTAAIENDISFEDYALGCARAFGAGMHQHNDPANKKLKLHTIENNYRIDSLSKAREEVAKLEAMRGVNDRTAYGKGVIEEESAANQKSFNQKVFLRNKYEAMLSKVYDWRPPTAEHENLKKFMIDQINQSINFDCDTKYDMERLTQLSRANPLDAYKKSLDRAYENVAYYEIAVVEEREKVESANRWISALYDSLGIEYESE